MEIERHLLALDTCDCHWKFDNTGQKCSTSSGRYWQNQPSKLMYMKMDHVLNDGCLFQYL